MGVNKYVDHPFKKFAVVSPRPSTPENLYLTNTASLLSCREVNRHSCKVSTMLSNSTTGARLAILPRRFLDVKRIHLAYRRFPGIPGPPMVTTRSVARKERRTALRKAGVLTLSQATSPNHYSNSNQAAKAPAQSLLGRTVDVPAIDLGVDIPGMIYRARILTRDNRREDRVLVKFFEDDDSESWLPTEAARRWLQKPREGTLQCTNEETDLYGAECLMMLQRPPKQSIHRIDGDENLELKEEHLSNSTVQDGVFFPTPPHCVAQDDMSSAA